METALLISSWISSLNHVICLSTHTHIFSVHPKILLLIFWYSSEHAHTIFFPNSHDFHLLWKVCRNMSNLNSNLTKLFTSFADQIVLHIRYSNILKTHNTVLESNLFLSIFLRIFIIIPYHIYHHTSQIINTWQVGHPP